MKRLLICVLALALLAGCAPASVQEPEDGKLHIVATVFPAYDFARAAVGDLGEVELLLPPGTESPTRARGRTFCPMRMPSSSLTKKLLRTWCWWKAAIRSAAR